MADEDYSAYLESVRKSPAPQVSMSKVAPVAAPVNSPQDFSSYLDRVKNNKAPVVNLPTAVTRPFGAAQEKPAYDYSKMNFSEDDLIKDEFFPPIQRYMVDRFGEHLKDENRDEVVSQFINNMRGFEGGNSYRALSEISFLNSIGEDKEKVARAGEAYTLYQNMQGVFGDTTGWERANAVWDYTRSAVLDPINILTLGSGKVATSVGFKAGSQMAMIAAKKTFNKTLAEETAKGVTTTLARKTAQEAGEKVLISERQKATLKTTERIVKRQAVEKAATTNLQRMTSSVALKEGAIVGTLEMAISAGTDYLYQDAMLRTKVQDEYNVYQTGLSAVIGLVAGGLSGMLGNVGAGKSKLVAPTPLKSSPTRNKVLGKVFDEPAGVVPTDPRVAPKPSIAMGDWMRDVASGKELKDLDNEFFLTMILGNDDIGLKGMGQTLLEDGYVWVRRGPDDKVSNWIGDIIKEADPQDAKKFLNDFSKATGITMHEGKALTVEAFADTFKKKMSDSGRLLNAVSQMSKLLGRELSTEEYLNLLFGGGVDDITTGFDGAVKGLGAKLGKTVDNIVNRDLPDLQNNVIRLMVSNLSTTALNITGYSAMTGLNSAADITRAILYGGKAGVLLAVDPAAAKKAGLVAKNIARNQIQKARNILDPNTTYETFLQYAQVRPDAMRQLTAVLPGGIESLNKLKKGFDPNKPLSTLWIEQGVDIAQRASFASAQDGLTKGIEFVSQLDGLLRRSADDGGFGLSWNEFFSDPTHHKQMLSDRYVRLEAKAIDSTLKAVFSKSYKGKDAVGQVAGLIEDLRNYPGIGILVPFGRFFNNTIAMMYNGTGILPVVSKFMGMKKYSSENWDEMASKALVSLGLLSVMVPREIEYMDAGLGWSEEISTSTGEVIDERYEFPYSAYKAMARYVAHKWSGTEIPGDLITQFSDQFFGQLTRQLGDTGKGMSDFLVALLSDEGDGIAKTFLDTMGTIPARAMSGATRPLEPINALIGLARDEEFYTPDRKQGNKNLNESLRYLDQFAAILLGENIAPPKYSAAEGKPMVQATKLISTSRPSRLTNVERVMNAIGLPNYKANMSSLSEPADNRYGQLFNTLTDEGAGMLWNSNRFQKGDLEQKTALWKAWVSQSTQSVKDYMGRYGAGNNDPALLKLIDISSGNSELKVRRTMEDLGFERPLDELSIDELYTLETALKFRDEYLLVK